MGKIADNIYGFVSRYKYLIVTFFALLITVFLDENSLMKRLEYKFQIADLEKEIENYNRKYEADSKRLKELERNPKMIERIAREKYFMKAKDEDVFVFSGE